MKTSLLILAFALVLSSCSVQPRASWITTTENEPWQEQSDLVSASSDTIPTIDAVIHTHKKGQKIDGFGACFNELGWISLSKLDPTVREEIMEELFFPEIGANFTICRMPVGANDFSRDWYSYNETEGDFEMEYFTIANDQQTLIPFIKGAQKYNSDLRIWASPWCPPAWMKYNKHYASAYTGEAYNEKYRNGLPADKVGYEGTDMFMERANEALVDTILTDPVSGKYISAVGFQWAGKGAIKGIHERYPDMKLYQTEQECGDGKNDWSGAVYSWNLMRHYLDNGASAYMYWNISLDKGGISRWGWAQNSLVVVDPDTKTFHYTPEYYVMKHLSHYVQPGARKLETSGQFSNLMAFVNSDKSIVVALANEGNEDRQVSVEIDGRVYQPVLPAHSIATLLID